MTRKLAFLLRRVVVVAITLLFLGCDNEEAVSPNVVGEWLFYSASFTNCDGGVLDDLDEDFDGCSDNNCIIFKLNSDQTFEYTFYYETGEYISLGEYALVGNQITFTCSSGDYCDEFKKLNVSVVSDEMTFTGQTESGCDLVGIWKKSI